MQPSTRILVASLLLAMPCSALALRINYSAELGLMYSDNITLSATDPVSENVLIPRLNFEIAEEGSTVQAQVGGTVEYRYYLGDEFGSEFRGALDGTVNWVLMPERLDWEFADNLGLYPVSLRAPDVPDNLQQTNVFSTGPKLRFRLGPATQGQAELRYVDSRAEESDDFDSQRLVGALRAIHELAPTRRISANLVAQDVEFTDDLLANDFVGYSIFGGYVENLSQIDLDFALGYTHLNFARGDDASGPLVRAGVDWRTTERTTLSFDAALEYTDAASSLAAGDGSDFDSGLGSASIIGTEAISADVYQEKLFEFGYHFVATRLNVDAIARYSTYRYEDLTGLLSNRDETGLGFNIGYLLRPRLTLGFIAEANDREFTVTRTSERDYRIGTYLAQQLGPQWSWRADLARYDRNGDGDIASFNENSVYFRIIYTR
jgi:hypothetical protein